MNCCNEKCEAAAAARVYWPGRDPRPMCLLHAAKAQHVAETMGVHLVIEEMRDDEDAPEDPCPSP